MTNESAIRHPLKAPDRLGGVTEVAPGVVWVRMPLDDRLNHINVWLVADGEGWTLIDTGICSDETRALWERIFVEHVRGPLKRIICTHYHPDHIGLAGWIQDRTGVEVWITQEEIDAARLAVAEPTQAQSEIVRAFYARFSAEPRQAEFLTMMRSMIYPLPAKLRLIDDPSITIGDGEWRVIIGRGHSPAHACLYSERLQLLISGDQVLPGISSNVSMDPLMGEADPLQRYLDSCASLALLPPDTWVLPSHRDVFIGLHRRLGELVAGIHRRLELIADTCEEPTGADQILAAIYPGKLGGLGRRLAIGEMAAYLNHLQLDGRLEFSSMADGSGRWRATADRRN